ncbi:MAG: hypothetical protein K2J32_09365 [Ruminococcus sp.]|nr:hypothetical protein [Ruminococcus sp.]
MKLNLKKKQKVKIKDEKIKLKKKKPHIETEGLGWDILELIIDIIVEFIFD